MGWSLDLLIPRIDEYFGEVKYEVIRPDATRPYVYFNYEGEINLVLKKKLCALFPEDVYVIFYPYTLDNMEVTKKDVEFPQGKAAKLSKPIETKVESPFKVGS